MAALTWSRSAVNAATLAPKGPIVTSGLTQATLKLLGRISGGVGAVEELSGADVRSIAAAAASGLATATGVTMNTGKLLGRTTAGVGAIEEFDFIAGTWTPVFTFATPGDLSVSYASQVGNYFKIGPMVFWDMNLQFTPTHTTASGEARVTGLPATAGGQRNFGAIVPFTTGLPFPAGRTFLVWDVGPGVTYLRPIGIGDAQAAGTFSPSQFTTGAAKTFLASGVYRAAA